MGSILLSDEEITRDLPTQVKSSTGAGIHHSASTSTTPHADTAHEVAGYG